MPEQESLDNPQNKDLSVHATFVIPDEDVLEGLEMDSSSHSNRHTMTPLEFISGEEQRTGRLQQRLSNNRNSATPQTQTTRRRGFSTGTDVNFVYKYLLLFSGVRGPSSYFSVWWIAYFGWRLLVILSLFLLAITFSTKPRVAQMWFFAPLFFATIVAGSMWSWLPKAFESVLNHGGSEMSVKDARNVIKVPTAFISVWLALGVFFAASRAYVTHRFLPCLFTFCIENATTPILGSVLLALTIDTRLAKNEIDIIINAAIDRSLTYEMYLDVRESVKTRSQRWSVCLWGLTFTALYCTFGFIITLGYLWRFRKSTDDEQDDTLGIFYSNNLESDILLDVIIASELAKEVALLFIFLFLVMGINDRADALTAVLLAGRWGEPSDPEEVLRAHLLFLNTTYAPTPDKLKSWYNFFTKTDAMPISFLVFGIRVSRNVVVFSVVSLMLGLLNALGRTFYTS